MAALASQRGVAAYTERRKHAAPTIDGGIYRPGRVRVGNATMNVSNERAMFSQRLQQALQDAHYSPDSPTRLAREFNLRFDGHPITVHAARKWLVGEAIPTQEKLRMMATWLGVSTEWLRFGGAEGAASAGANFPHVESADVRLIADLHRLDEHHRAIAREFIRVLVRTNQQK
jgi:hypothetical protein